MKKIYLIILCAIIVSATIFGVAYAIGISKKQEIFNEESDSYKLIEKPNEYIEKNKVLIGDSSSIINIPVYNHVELFSDNDCGIYLGRDAGFGAEMNTRRDTSQAIFTAFPSQAIRENSKSGNIYTIYDTDIGVRVYLFFSQEKNAYRTLDGYPIIIEKVLEYSDFSNITVGENITAVQNIDPIIEHYIAFFDKGSDEALKGYTKVGAGHTSIHLLSDGILKIEYERISLGDYAITNIEYQENFILSGLNGDTYYQIFEDDYIK